MRRFLLLIFTFFTLQVVFSQQVVGKDKRAIQKFSQEEIQIYPNPTSDIFYLKNDKFISALVIYNIIGKEVKRYKHTEGNSYSVVDLHKGIYIVRMFDEKKKVVKVLRLNRK